MMNRYRSQVYSIPFLAIAWWVGVYALGKAPAPRSSPSGRSTVSEARQPTASSKSSIRVTVRAGDQSVREVPLSIAVPKTRLAPARAPRAGETSCQVVEIGGGRIELYWVARDLKKDEARVFRLVPAPRKPGTGVEVKRDGENLDLFVDGRLFTRYDTTTGPNKPYLYPLNSPSGKSIIRHWPMKEIEGETRDHPHHRGLWYTHGKVGGFDFWTEDPKAGKTVHMKFGEIRSGPVMGSFTDSVDWVAPTGEKVARDIRTITVYRLPDAILMDFRIRLFSMGKPLTLGDTKEGAFGLRVADSMRATAGGQIVNSRGLTNTATWGKPAEWVDYSGPVDGETAGVAIFDHPENPRFPTTWHVRDYGLFAVNPFGLHDFNPAANPAGAGDLVIPAGKSALFRYRLLFHRGDAAQAGVEDHWRAYAHRPKGITLD